MAQSTEGVPRPTIGRVVHYRSKMGLHYSVPAIVTAVKDSIDPEGVRLGGLPDIEVDTEAHLFVMSPGEKGHYTEFNVPYSEAPVPGTWAWPPRVG